MKRSAEAISEHDAPVPNVKRQRAARSTYSRLPCSRSSSSSTHCSLPLFPCSSPRQSSGSSRTACEKPHRAQHVRSHNTKRKSEAALPHSVSTHDSTSPHHTQRLRKSDLRLRRNHNSQPLLPLTPENLSKLEAETESDMPPRTGSRSPIKGSSTKSSQGGFKLRCFSVYCGGRNQPLPTSLQTFVHDVLLQRHEKTTPSASRIAARALAMGKLSEANGKQHMRHLLVPKSAMLWGLDDGGIDLLDTSSESNLNSIFLPEPVDTAAKLWFDKLETPRPDEAVGYLRCHLAESNTPRLVAPFTAAEERIFAHFDVCKELTFPFLTFQWKSALNNGSTDQAERQAARDGAAMVNSMYQFLKAAYADSDRDGSDPAPEDIAHISITCDLRTVIAWVHWREVDDDGSVTYEMERVAQSFCNDANALSLIRDLIKNVTAYALGSRLVLIRRAVKALGVGLEKRVLQDMVFPTPAPSETREPGEPPSKRAKTVTASAPPTTMDVEGRVEDESWT